MTLGYSSLVGTRVAFPVSTKQMNQRRSGSGGLMRIDDVLQRIQGEYVEMPGLRLTPAQAQRLWGLERDVCNALLGALVDAKFLAQTRDGAYVRLEGARPSAIGNAHGGQKLAVA